MMLPPKERTIGKPKDGWRKGTYLVRVAFNSGNPIHNAILCVKFLRSGEPINESLWCPNWEREYWISDLHYLEIVGRSEELSGHLGAGI